MHNLIRPLLALCLLTMGWLLPHTVHARDSQLRLPVAEVLDPAYHQGKLDGSVQFYFADQATPPVRAQRGEGVANRKTNAANKSDREACRWVMLSALIALQDAAKDRGANAVINIQSYYKKHEFASSSEYECGAGALLAGVTLTGTYAELDAP